MQKELRGCVIAERTVREYVHTRKIALDLLVYAWGAEAQIDWHEAYADVAGSGCRC